MDIIFPNNRDGVLYEGTKYNFKCVVTPNRTGVDTDFIVNATVRGPRTSSDMDRIIVSSVTMNGSNYEIRVEFRALRLEDNGIYNCSAVSMSKSRYVITSEMSIRNWTLRVNGK